MIAMVGDLSTSEAEAVLAEVSGLPVSSNLIMGLEPLRKENGSESASGGVNKVTSGSSNSKSGEKCLSSEEISLEGIWTEKPNESLIEASNDIAAGRVKNPDLI